MRRNKLVMRQKTKIAQKLPDDLDDKVVNFHTYVINLRKKHGYELSQIINMDETPMFFDMPGNRTVNKSGERTVFVKTTGHVKQHFTVVLACCADGNKLKPLVIFKRKTLPKVKFQSGVFVHVHPKGWMDEQGTRLWIDNVYTQRQGGVLPKKSLLVWDMFQAHLVDPVKSALKSECADIAVIPRGLTSVLQPLDVSVNKPFKDAIRRQWNEWMVSGEKSLTPKGNVRSASLTAVVEWVKNAWDSISPTIIVRSFKKCGISNKLDGSEDDMLWEQAADEESAVNDVNVEEDGSDSGPDPYEYVPTQGDWDELFGEDSSVESDFEGF